MKNLKKISIATIIIGFFIIPDYSCKKHCDMDPESSLSFAFNVLDSEGNNITHFFDEDTIKIHKLDFPDSIADYLVHYYKIRFDFSKYKPHIGNHDIFFSVYWKYEEIDTMRLIYTVSPEPEGSCFYELTRFNCFINETEIKENHQTGIWEYTKETK